MAALTDPDPARRASAVVLTLNAGSSTLKAGVVAGRARVAAAAADWDQSDPGRTLDALLATLGDAARPGGLLAVAHRVVHGGPRLRAHAIVNPEVLEAIAEATRLAPLHNRVALETIDLARDRLPGVPHVACFDTAFHAGLPPLATTEPVPARWRERGVRRYGFHGLSVAWSTRRTAEVLGRPPEALRIVVAHLGSGASVTAVDGGRSAWSSMGYTPLDGIMMATRPGALDPGILLAAAGFGESIDRIAAGVEHESGLAGVSGSSGDVRRLEGAAATGDADARLALDLFAARAAAGIAAASTWLPRLDALVFTGGIGEHAGVVRAAIAGRLASIGVPSIAAAETGQDRVIEAGPPAVLRIEAAEDLVMADVAEELVAPR